VPLAYSLVERELAQVTERLQALAHTEAPGLGAVLGQVLDNRGKLLRPTLCLTSGLFANYSTPLLVPMAAGVELLHTATLVHDDAIDHAETRRGQPTVSSTWGDHTAVMVGDYLLACAAKLVASTHNLRVIDCFAETLRVLCDGEIRQELGAYQLGTSRDDYLQRITNKTAYLFATATECGAVLSAADEQTVQALRRYGTLLGTAFQMVDDILDFTATPEQLGKPAGSDLEQGTLTLPSILFLEMGGSESIVRVAWDKQSSRQQVNDAVEAIRSSRAVAASFEEARQLAVQARQCLDCLADVPARRALEELVDYVVQRPN